MLTPKDKKLLVAESDCAAETIRKIYCGRPVFLVSYRRVLEAAKKLKVALPPAWVPAVVGHAARIAKESESHGS
jgi:DNA topoisomerase IA